jgi:protein-disulfide isomerase
MSFKPRLALFAALMATGVSLPAMAEETLSRDQVKEIVRQFIIDNPEVILESVNNMQAKRQQEMLAQAQEKIKSNKDKLFNDPDSPVIGNPKGDVTVVEFFDYNCGYCKHALPEIAKLIENDKNVRVVFKELPILSESSDLAARAALAVHKLKPDQYFAYHSALMKSTGQLNEEKLLDIAKMIGIDGDKLKEKMNSEEIKAIITKDRELAQAIGVQGTPAFIIGEEFMPGAIGYDTMKEKVEATRAAKKE